MDRALDDWIDRYMDYTENTEPPAGFRRWVALSTLASVMERKCFLQWGTETFFPNMFIVLVGPPAARKGTAMRVGKAFLDNLGVPASSNESSRQKLIKSLQESATIDQDTDGDMIHHSSMTIHSSELTVFLGYGSREMLSMLCNWYDCENRFVYDTHARGKEEIPNVWVHLLGATTPGQLRAALPEDAVGSGFTSRVVFIYEEKKGKTVLKPSLSPEQERLGEALASDLTQVRNIVGEFHPTPEFESLYYEWYADSESRQIFLDPRLDYYVQRRPTHLFKLSILCCASRTNDRVLTKFDLERAIKYLHEVERDMPQVFAGVGMNPLAATQHRLLSLVKRSGTISLAEVTAALTDEADITQIRTIVEGLRVQRRIQYNVQAETLTYREN